MSKLVDAEFTTNNKPVMAIVSGRNCTYVICRGEGAAAQVRTHLQDMAPVKVMATEAYRAIPDAVKNRYHISSDSIVKLPESDLGRTAMALSEDASGSPNNHLLSDSLKEQALKAATVRKR